MEPSEGQGLPSQVFFDNWSRLRRDGGRWSTLALQRAGALGIERWRRIALALLAAWMIANAARLVWLLLPLNPAPAPLPPAVNSAALPAKARTGTIDIETLVGWHLYGEVGAQPRAAAIEEQAQETTLNLQLLGVIAASEPAQARAFILADGRQQQYAVGETLPGGGNVTLSKVLIDRAIINNNGRLETLWLYDPAQSLQPPQSTPDEQPADDEAGATVDLRADPQVSAMAQNYRQQLYQNPASLADVIQVAPAMENGRLAGYRISPGRDQAQFEKFGLKAGDIVTAVNGIGLDDPQRAVELYNLIRSARDASITVRRGSDVLTMMVSLENND